jgi:hypothetical protein
MAFVMALAGRRKHVLPDAGQEKEGHDVSCPYTGARSNVELGGPEDTQLFLDACEVSVAGGESSFASDGERGKHSV